MKKNTVSKLDDDLIVEIRSFETPSFECFPALSLGLVAAADSSNPVHGRQCKSKSSDFPGGNTIHAVRGSLSVFVSRPVCDDRGVLRTIGKREEECSSDK